jgi:hypothetical protein
MVLAGYSVTLVCLPEEATLINQEGTRVRLQIGGKDEPIEVDWRKRQAAFRRPHRMPSIRRPSISWPWPCKSRNIDRQA